MNLDSKKLFIRLRGPVRFQQAGGPAILSTHQLLEVSRYEQTAVETCFWDLSGHLLAKVANDEILEIQWVTWLSETPTGSALQALEPTIDEEGMQVTKPENFQVKARRVYPKAFLRWREEDENLLSDLFYQGSSIAEMADKLGRGQKGVLMHLRKLGKIRNEAEIEEVDELQATKRLRSKEQREPFLRQTSRGPESFRAHGMVNPPPVTGRSDPRYR